MRNRKPFLPIVLFFIVLNGFFIAGKNMLQRWNADQGVLIVGNLILFLVTIISFFIAQSGVKSSNSHAFMRSIFGGILLKLFVSAIAAFIYIAMYRKAINKAGLFICMGLYLLYTFLEVSVLTKQVKQQPNAAQRSTH